ncbi:zinc finger CCHC domain-containing protein 10 [Impatiens glandulifera]|uniref:zinc finger CCHC domain-containing protein 10 n=1 Tax=Impatiens glandulifera TaxID=253017 RepID=UPI001FB075E4|nr:zinc finger CCHC domain-containing protein 10 [Impatiens glandulifera]
MSSGKNDEGHTQDATERLKAAALTAAKGLSRAQAERAAAAAVRNVNAYGQKEEGPSRWQERKEAKRQMYLMSTEKQVRLGERKESMANVGKAVATCQKCFQPGHWTYECKNERVYISRPSRTQQLKNPKLRMKLSITCDLDDNGDDGLKEEPVKKSKRKHKSGKKSESDSEASVFDSDSSSGSGSENSSGKSDLSYSSSSDSEEERRKKRKKKKQQQRKRRHRRYSSTSESSDSESESDSDSDKGSRKKGKRHSKRRN